MEQKVLTQSQLLAGAGICRDLEYTLGRMTTQAAWLCHTSFPVCNKNCCCDFFSTRVYLEGVRMCWRGGHSRKGLEWPDRGGSVAKLILWKVHWVRCGSSAHRMFAGHSLNLEKGCRAHSEQLANNSKYVGWNLLLRGAALSLAICYITGESCYIFWFPTTSLIDIEIAWAMHYKQLD